MLRFSAFLISCILLTGCSDSQQPRKAAPPAVKQAEPPPAIKPTDEARRFPTKNQVEMKLVEDHILDKQNLPGGNLATYQAKGKTYQLFLVKAKSPETAAIWLLDLKATLKNSAFVSSFGGYYGLDQDKPLFLFQKGSFLAGISGLKQADADKVAREFAARIN